jgi:transposase
VCERVGGQDTDAVKTWSVNDPETCRVQFRYAGWCQFMRWVRYYGALHEIEVIAVAPQFTSQECSACGTLVKKSLSVRTHICPGCGIVLDRDLNAALNILAKALDGTLGHRETSGSPENAWGEVTATALLAMATQQVASLNQEPTCL